MSGIFLAHAVLGRCCQRTRKDRRYRLEPKLKDFRFADVAGVDDQLEPARRRRRFGPGAVPWVSEDWLDRLDLASAVRAVFDRRTSGLI